MLCMVFQIVLRGCIEAYKLGVIGVKIPNLCDALELGQKPPDAVFQQTAANF